MTDEIFDIDKTDAAHQDRAKAIAAKREADRIRFRDRLGDLVLAANVANGRTPRNLVGSWLWATEQAQSNPALNKEWDRRGAEFLGKSRAAKPTPTPSASGSADAGEATPASKPQKQPNRDTNAGPGDLLARAAAE